MKRREFLASGLGSTLAAFAFKNNSLIESAAISNTIRAAFPRLEKQTYLNAAGMMPLSTFSEAALHRYIEFQQFGHKHSEYVRQTQAEIRELFANLIGAQPSEIGLVHCTKAGEQIVLDSLKSPEYGENIVTNDLHFTGSLHNLIGLKKAGRDVRIVRAKDWQISLEDMRAVIDERTALVTISLVSNINGHVEDIAALSEIAHASGALVYADIIQAAGIMPFNVHELGIDVAACSCYKWLYGVHGTGFLFVNQKLQGTSLVDRLYPGHIRHNYSPWVETADLNLGDFIYNSRDDATRYQPGHVSYLGYCAAYEGLKFIETVGVKNALDHSVRLNQRLNSLLDPARYQCISPHLERSPIITFKTQALDKVAERLNEANIVVSISGNRLRVSPAMYNTEADIDALAEALNA